MSKHLKAWMVLACLTLLAGASYAEPVRLEQLMQKMASIQSKRISFIEEKNFEMLDEPLKSSGFLVYQAPDYMEKTTLKPRAEVFKVKGSLVSLTNKGKTKQMSLAEQPVMQAFIESIRGTLSGDEKTLQLFYDLKLQGEMNQWVLTLTPKKGDLRKILRKITLSGQQEHLRKVVTLETSGDETILTLLGASR